VSFVTAQIIEDTFPTAPAWSPRAGADLFEMIVCRGESGSLPRDRMIGPTKQAALRRRLPIAAQMDARSTNRTKLGLEIEIGPLIQSAACDRSSFF
jgi:hypothetical protein